MGDNEELIGTAMGDALATKLAADLRGILNPDAPPAPPAEGGGGTPPAPR
jgi:hypothetical protein